MAGIPKVQEIAIVTFKDGSVVRYSDYYTAIIWLEDISDNFDALNYLYQKCLNSPNLPTPSDASVQILKQYELIEKDNEVHSVVRKIVLNCIEASGKSLKVISALSHIQISKITVKA